MICEAPTREAFTKAVQTAELVYRGRSNGSLREFHFAVIPGEFPFVGYGQSIREAIRQIVESDDAYAVFQLMRERQVENE